jgi:sporulation protein YlmC with PRC-barrel domain
MAFGTVVFAADDNMTTPPAQNAPAQVAPTQQQLTSRRLSKLMGATVFSSDTQALGNVRDIVFDGARHQVGYIIISCDKVPGLADRLAAIPYQTVQFTGGDEARLTVDLQTIKNGPTFARGQWPTEVTADTYTGADDYYHKQAKVESNAMNAQPAAAQVGKHAIWTQRASDLMGRHVQTPTGEGLGDLKDIVLDEKTGATLYGVMSFGGMMGVGDKYFAIPIDDFKVEPGTASLVVQADKEQLKKASGFDKDHWPSRPAQPWMQ